MTSLVRRCASWCALMAAVCLLACDPGSPAAETSPPPGPASPTRPDAVPALPPVSVEAPGLDPAIFPAVGSSEFLSANENELLSSGVGGRGTANGRAELDDSDADGLAEAGGREDPGGAEPAPDPSREIVEADVYRLEGDLLYVLNRWRGLVIIDVSDPDHLRVRGRLPFQAIPVEMYVRDGRAYVLSSDYFTYWQYDPEADPHGFHGSQVMIIDVDDPDAPAQLGGLAVDGEITDSRMVGMCSTPSRSGAPTTGATTRPTGRTGPGWCRSTWRILKTFGRSIASSSAARARSSTWPTTPSSWRPRIRTST
ncbi:MAG: beta-propeller domain-containing protein [bacterium]